MYVCTFSNCFLATLSFVDFGLAFLLDILSFILLLFFIFWLYMCVYPCIAVRVYVCAIVCQICWSVRIGLNRRDSIGIELNLFALSEERERERENGKIAIESSTVAQKGLFQ